jgi:hypothetical protein
MLMVSDVLRPPITSSTIVSPIANAGTRIVVTGVILKPYSVLIVAAAGGCLLAQFLEVSVNDWVNRDKRVLHRLR